MNKIVETKIATISTEKYPLILLKSKQVSEIHNTDIDHLVTKYKTVLEGTKGHYVTYIDVSKSNKKYTAEARDYLGVSLQVLDSSYKDRHLGNFVFVPGIFMFFVIKMVSGFSKSEVKLTIGFNREKLMTKALSKLNKHNKVK